MLTRLSLLLGAVTLCAAAPGAPKRIRAIPRTGAPIVPDGRLDESAWAAAPVGTAFVERTPYPGKPPPVRTEFRVLYDEGTIYIGVTMYTDGVPPRDWERGRDSFGVFNDDAISLKFDVRLDSRTTVGFATNPAGVQLDYVAVENGVSFRREYDAIWEVGTDRTADAWVAEFAIPTIALGLPAGKRVESIGLQISRDHNARRATYDWSEMPPEFGATSALYYGRIDGLEGLSGGNPLTLQPYALAGLDYDAGQRPTRDDVDLKVGGDIRARFGEDIWTELTILTDFAQVDLDDPVVNTNRFKLFFPERRPFFLSGLEVFEYGAEGFSQVFFSRRIGLDDANNNVPLLGGLKSYGSVGDFRFGLLQVVTDQLGDTPARSYSVARARQNFGERGHLGLIATLQGRLPPLTAGDEPFEPNVSLGGDGAIRALDRRLELTGFFAGTVNQEGGLARGTSGEAAVAWKGENLQPAVSVAFVSERFDPSVGFVPRRDILQSRVDLNSVFRPEASGLQLVFANVSGQVIRQLSDGQVVGQTAELVAGVDFRSGYGVGVVAARVEDLVQEEFTLLGRIPIAADRYFGNRIYVYLQRFAQLNPYFDVGYAWDNSLFGGVIQTADAFVGFNLGGFARTEVGGEVAWFDFDGQDTIRTATFNGKLSITPSTKLIIDLIGQANTNEERVTALVRLRWRYIAGSDLFLVYRDTVPYGESELAPRRSLTFKLNYRFDALL